MDISDRMERLLALILLQSMNGKSQRDKILQLNLAGFSNIEIADIIQTTTAVVAQVIYEGKKKKGKRQASEKKIPAKKA